MPWVALRSLIRAELFFSLGSWRADYLAPKAPLLLRMMHSTTVFRAHTATINSRPLPLKCGNAISVVPILFAIVTVVIKTTSDTTSKAAVNICARVFTVG